MSRRIPADYPGKRSLTETEALNVLRIGPDPKYFEPWAERGVVLSGVTKRGYGYIHIHGSQGGTQCDVSTWDSQEGLNWGLSALHSAHARSRCDECQGLLYFTPDEPLRLRLVVETDEEEDEPEADQ